MKTEIPYEIPGLIAETTATSGNTYQVYRKGEAALLGHIRKTDKSEWEILDERQAEFKFSSLFGPISIRPFKSHHDAALFLQMRGRLYETTVTVAINNLKDKNESIRVRVAPNYGKWFGDGCEPGKWAASLQYGEGGSSAGLTMCANSVIGAMVAGIRKAYGFDVLDENQATLEAERLAWEERAE